ncbi:hypothetical protein GTS_34450 [Gandjariella thermophila]|uniref:Uncharacterized protein n=2 Tax=Gandjariella thermophila TaxID=1931992 RepID=A0A4D4J996_9PSEU|nr:hypothetical protein GTS_34450 [Gandjariella thermophila]
MAAHHLPAASALTSTNPSPRPKKGPRACGTPGYPARQPGNHHAQATKTSHTTTKHNLPTHSPTAVKSQGWGCGGEFEANGALSQKDVIGWDLLGAGR